MPAAVRCQGGRVAVVGVGLPDWMNPSSIAWHPPELLSIEQDGRRSVVVEFDFRIDDGMGDLDAFSASIRHRDFGHVAQWQDPSVAQTAHHRDRSAHPAIPTTPAGLASQLSN